MIDNLRLYLFFFSSVVEFFISPPTRELLDYVYSEFSFLYNYVINQCCGIFIPFIVHLIGLLYFTSYFGRLV